MEFEFPAAEMFEASIRRLENIDHLAVGQAMPEGVESELQALRNELIENHAIARQIFSDIVEQFLNVKRNLEEEKKTLEEDADDHIKRVARHEGDIFRLDEEIEKLRGEVTQQQEEIESLQDQVRDLRTQQAATQNELVETRTNLTAQLQQMQQELAELRGVLNH